MILLIPCRWLTGWDMPRPIPSNTVRAGHPAAAEEVQVPEQVKAERLEALQQLLNAQQYAFNKSTEGRDMRVLIERAGGRPGQVAGRSLTCRR